MNATCKKDLQGHGDTVFSNYNPLQNRNDSIIGIGNEFSTVIAPSEHFCTNSPTNLHTPTRNFAGIDKVWIRFANMGSYTFRIYGAGGCNGKLTEVSNKCDDVSTGFEQ